MEFGLLGGWSFKMGVRGWRFDNLSRRYFKSLDGIRTSCRVQGDFRKRWNATQQQQQELISWLHTLTRMIKLPEGSFNINSLQEVFRVVSAFKTYRWSRVLETSWPLLFVFLAASDARERREDTFWSSLKSKRFELRAFSFWTHLSKERTPYLLLHVCLCR